ncbi:N-acetylmuramoyl-L-alanine amidase family protein [Ructibacterium gallinarum]|uniref:N-acetylmuramoyl-L-alanine amidase n=1 Tax=Ructibacterium gallinarum TaxID=2779355 RepID=A0A9D5M5P8_9FIRM|nr:N-acetylmuramoyl-L-alanine amidase [Ructibacterium gallinarum]MBE5041090.1 N-acetylmuramoyl-L-alanine amidase [Ructibacterium gallinarum]
MKIYLDPGHNYSGFDTGAAANGLKEQEITFLIAEKIKDRLAAAGAEVKMSRSQMTDNLGVRSVASSLSARSDGANRWGADLFVSIHCNAGGGTGSETYAYAGGITAGYRLAENIQTALNEINGLPGRGVKINPALAVLKNTKMPAALVETAFIDHAADAALLKSENGRERIAQAISEGICRYAGLPCQKEEFTVTQYEELKTEITALRQSLESVKETLDSLKYPALWNYIDQNLPVWAAPTVEKLTSRGLLQGDENGLGLSEEMLRILVICDRSGVFD